MGTLRNRLNEMVLFSIHDMWAFDVFVGAEKNCLNETVLLSTLDRFFNPFNYLSIYLSIYLSSHI